jgi:hypothetical protein
MADREDPWIIGMAGEGAFYCVTGYVTIDDR